MYMERVQVCTWRGFKCVPGEGSSVNPEMVKVSTWRGLKCVHGEGSSVYLERVKVFTWRGFNCVPGEGRLPGDETEGREHGEDREGTGLAPRCKSSTIR